jgi:hypothetical protein
VVAAVAQWPGARDFSEALQHPRTAFRTASLQSMRPAVDRFGMPVLACGNFAAVCKMTGDADTVAVRYFTRDPGDRQARYRRIHEFLAAHEIAAIASSQFLPDEILVHGRRLPIMRMEWIEGVRLDLYVAQVLGDKAALAALADDWLRVVSALEQAGAAHGDLQHGNVLVAPGRLRLVDLDGMFVPGMEAMGACEDGHPAYQHPRRREAPFDARLDRFSSLVVYASIVALKEQPELWQRFHDDNLIFKRADFVSPERSEILRVLRAASGDAHDLAEALAAACSVAPQDVPTLAALGRKVSALPAWMVAPAAVRIAPRSREIAAGEAIVAPTPAPPSPLPELKPVSSLARYVARHPPAAPQPQSVTSPPRLTLAQCLWRAIVLTLFPMLLPFGLLGIPIMHALLMSVGAGIVHGTPVAWAVYITASFVVVLQRELRRHHAGARRAAPTGSDEVVGNRLHYTFHRPACRLARTTAYANVVRFPSRVDARRAGYQACSLCKP